MLFRVLQRGPGSCPLTGKLVGSKLKQGSHVEVGLNLGTAITPNVLTLRKGHFRLFGKCRKAVPRLRC